MEDGTFSVFICLFFVFIIIFLDQRNQQLGAYVLRRKRRKGIKSMNQAITSYIGARCAVTTMSGTTVTGMVEAVDENWITLRRREDQPTEAINLDFVTRIRALAVKKPVDG